MKIDAFDLRFHHVGDGIAARTADADDHILGRRSSSDAGPILILIKIPLGIRKSRAHYVTLLRAKRIADEAGSQPYPQRPNALLCMGFNHQKYSRTA